MCRLLQIVLSGSLLFAAAVEAATIYVAPNGSAANPGTEAAPTVLSLVASGVYKPNGTEVPVPAGSTIWLLPGTYQMPRQSNGQRYLAFYLSGSPTAQTILRSKTDYLTGTRAIIDGAMLIMGSYVTYWGMEVWDSQLAASSRTVGVGGFSTANYLDAIVRFAVPGTGTPSYFGVKFVNMNVHDGLQGFGFWRTAPGAEIYGCLIHDNGYDASDRGHGHGIYTQNYTGQATKKITDNILFRGYGFNLHGYGENSQVDEYDIQGNISFNAGTKRPVVNNQDPNYLITSGAPISDLLFCNNVSYHKVTNAIESSAAFGNIWTGDGGSLTFNNNYLMGQNGVQFEDFMTVNASGNTIASYNKILVNTISGVGYPSRDWNAAQNTYITPNPTTAFNGGSFANYVSSTGNLETGSTVTTGTRPASNYVFIRPNRYEPGRGHIAVFNWQNLSAINLNLSAILSVGDNYRIWNVENGIYGAPAVSGTYTGAAVTLPLSANADTPQFDSFLVVRTATGQSINAPEIAISGNAQNIVAGDASPSLADHTDFGTIAADGASVTRMFTVTNSGNATLTLSAFILPSGFISGGDELLPALAPGASDTFSVTLPVSTPGTYSGQLSFSTNDTDENPFSFTIRGSVSAPTAPEVVVSGNSVQIADGDLSPSLLDHTDFGALAQGATALTRTFTVTNAGTATLTLSSVTLPSGFVSGGKTLVASLAPGASDTFNVTLGTATAGSFSGQISFNTNDADAPVFNFAIAGMVSAASGKPTVTVAVIDASASESGTPAADSATIRVSRTGSTTTALTVNFTRGGTALHGATADYTLKDNDGTSVLTSAVIDAGESFVDVIVYPYDNITTEASETVILTLASSTNYILGSTKSGTITIADNEPVVTIVAVDPDAAESGAPPSNPGLIRIYLSTAPTLAPLAVRFTLSGSSAMHPGDFTMVAMNLDGTEGAAISSPVSIPVGCTFLDIGIKPVDDTQASEAQIESARIALMASATSSYKLGAAQSAIVNISDNE